MEVVTPLLFKVELIMGEHKEAQATAFMMTQTQACTKLLVLQILYHFDGYGLVITDYDLIKERFKAMQELKQLESLVDIHIQNTIKGDV